MQSWKKRMAATESALKASDYEQALRLANTTVSEMAERLGPGEGSTQLFTTAIAHKALAHAGAGERAEAVWYWQLALDLDPQLQELDLTAFGDPASLLVQHRERQGPSEVVRPETGEIQPPKVVKKRKPKFPHGAHYFGVSGDLVVEVVVTSDGKIREPRIVTPLPAATLSFAALEAMKTWRFEPARVGGRPVDMVFNLTVNYKN